MANDLCLSLTVVVRSAGSTGAVLVEVDRLSLFGPPLGYGAGVQSINTTVSNILSLAIAFGNMTAEGLAQILSARLERLA